MHWSFQPVGGPLFTAVVAAVLVALVWVVPRPRPEGTRLWTLRGVRLLVVLLVLAAMLRPTLLRTETRPLEASLLLLIDQSRSMGVEDSLAGESRWGSAKRMLDDSQAAIEKLAARWDVQGYCFASELTEVTVDGGRVELPLAADGESTSLGAALDDLLERGGGERLLGVVVMSDGAQRALPPRDTAPQLAARRLAAENVPLFTATFGQPGGGDRADLAIDDLAASESAFVKAPTEVIGRLRASGFAGREFTVQLLWENGEGEMSVVDAESITIDRAGADGGYSFRLRHTPLEAGERKLTVRVVEPGGGEGPIEGARPIEGELITTNNEQSTFITVRDGGVKVLYLVGAKRIGGTPGLEQRFVRAALAASPDIVVTRRLFDYRQRELSLPVDPNGASPDVVILDDLDAAALNERAWSELAEMVRGGVGLGVIGGRHSFGPGGYRGNPVADVLPVGLGPAERQTFGQPLRRDVHIEGPLRMFPTDRFGRSHPIMQLAPGGERSEEIWSQLPALDGANHLDTARLKPNAIALAQTDEPRPRPLLVIGQAGAGRVMASAVDSTWRWRLGGFSEPHRRFWRQAVLWLAKKDDSSDDPVWVRLDSRRVPRGGRLDLRVGVRSDGLPASGEEIRYEAKVQTPDGRTLDLATGLGPESSALFGDTRTPGDYRVLVTALAGAEDNAETLGSAEARFSVPDQDLELDNPAAEPSLMAQLAATTSSAGGRAIAPEELPALLEEFAERQPELEEEVLARITYWDTWPFFLLVVGLLGCEWYLRKRWGLV